jgi:hypothetical protein
MSRKYNLAESLLFGNTSIFILALYLPGAVQIKYNIISSFTFKNKEPLKTVSYE